MKLLLTLLLTVVLFTNIFAQNELNKDNKSICSFIVGNNRITLEEKQNINSFLENGDKVKFYKTILSAIVENGSEPKTVIIDSTLYTTNEYHKTMLPCILVNTSQKVMYIFSNSKSTDFNYGMDGYVYSCDLDLDSIKRETIFKGLNAGWSSFFGGSFRGNPELWHFSAAGGFVILSKRRGNNTWTNDIVGDIDPKLVEKQYDSHKNILFATLPNMDSMKFY